jgi:hypothetical protein
MIFLRVVMKFPSLFAAGASLSLISCGSMDAVRDAPVATRIAQFSLADLRPAKVPVVEAREKDLKELPTGQERALAYEQSRKKNLWAFAGPVIFHEPMLPEGSGFLDGSLLPPKLE